jgi:hypothetical protein
LDLAGWPALPGGWWLCAVGRPTPKRPYLLGGGGGGLFVLAPQVMLLHLALALTE